MRSHMQDQVGTLPPGQLGEHDRLPRVGARPGQRVADRRPGLLQHPSHAAPPGEIWLAKLGLIATVGQAPSHYEPPGLVKEAVFVISSDRRDGRRRVGALPPNPPAWWLPARRRAHPWPIWQCQPDCL